MHRFVIAALAAVALVTPLHVLSSVAEASAVVTPTPTEIKDSAARRSVSAFEKAMKAASKNDATLNRREAELHALHELAGGRHARVAEAMIEVATDDDVLPDTRIAALGALPLQGDAAVKPSRKLLRWFADQADEAAEALAKGDIGLPMDRSGEPISTTREARDALRKSETRARIVTAALSAVRRLEVAPKEPAEALRPFLQSPHDDLVIAALEAAGAWDARDLAADVALLLRMYPAENRWETGAVTHIGGTNASAKAAWMRLFGHPLKQQARPAVYRTVVATLTEWAGTDIRDPATCDAWLATIDD